jgi:hypothetical protein
VFCKKSFLWVAGLVIAAGAAVPAVLLAFRGPDADMVMATKDGPRTVVILPAGEGPHPTVIVLHGAMDRTRASPRPPRKPLPSAGNSEHEVRGNRVGPRSEPISGFTASFRTG